MGLGGAIPLCYGDSLSSHSFLTSDPRGTEGTWLGKESSFAMKKLCDPEPVLPVSDLRFPTYKMDTLN